MTEAVRKTDEDTSIRKTYSREPANTTLPVTNYEEESLNFYYSRMGGFYFLAQLGKSSTSFGKFA